VSESASRRKADILLESLSLTLLGGTFEHPPRCAETLVLALGTWFYKVSTKGYHSKPAGLIN
jgi:hypothetical protein